MSSATEPFQPLERTARVTRSVLEMMLDRPPDLLIVQSHSHHVADYLDLYPQLARRIAQAGLGADGRPGGELRFHVSIETDRDRLPGTDLPPSASPVEKRIAAAAALKAAGLRVVATVSPLLPIAHPERFFLRLAEAADAVVIDHFIGGDGSPGGTGARTRRTRLPLAMEQAEPRSVTPAYLHEMTALARRILGPARVGVNIPGFAGRFSSAG